MQEYVMSTEPFWNWLEKMSVLKKCSSKRDKAT